MKTIEFNPDGQSTAISPNAAADEAARNEVLLGIMPLVFHKLKNKLTPILGYTQILQAKGCDEFSRERLGRIEKNTTELSETLNTLKDFCTPAAAALRPGDLNAVVEGLAPEWRALAAGSGARVVLELADGLPAMPLHAGHLRVMLMALAANAACALAAKPAAGRRIRVATGAAPGALLLSIHDNGRGMSADEAANAWTPFFSTFPGHTGLGLVMCEKVIADHGAACAVDSAPGEFSEFTIAFPTAKKENQSRNGS